VPCAVGDEQCPVPMNMIKALQQSKPVSLLPVYAVKNWPLVGVAESSRW
jgi:hypothetical protein